MLDQPPRVSAVLDALVKPMMLSELVEALPYHEVSIRDALTVLQKLKLVDVSYIPRTRHQKGRARSIYRKVACAEVA